MERAVLNRMKPYLEDNEIYPHNINGFRQGLATEDAMKLVKIQILDSTTRGVNAILGLGLEKALDNTRHSFVLQEISTPVFGQRLLDYIRDFLRGRQASLRVGSLQLEPLVLGCTRTPHGSVISPTLFNLALIGLSRQLT
ncbi:putative nicotine oxidoreductase [Dermacentor variabilis]|uniref:putative nicotine oxidoreductase n=1 Tax=Dermacentor variabilis TaxID=34621 RepID=UPI003F5B77D4